MMLACHSCNPSAILFSCDESRIPSHKRWSQPPQAMLLTHTNLVNNSWVRTAIHNQHSQYATRKLQYLVTVRSHRNPHVQARSDRSSSSSASSSSSSSTPPQDTNESSPNPERGKFLSFEEARSFMHTQDLRSWDSWWDWCRRGERPANIPVHPERVYRGWQSVHDWLGYTPFNEFLPFEEAREYVRGLGLKSKKEWHEWCSSGKRPENIPSSPNVNYANEGWLGYPDWLGYGVGKRSFEEARRCARGLGFESVSEWREWSSSGARPESIPSCPERQYADKGWVSYPDWLGYGIGKRGAGPMREFLPFEEARSFMHTQGLRSAAEWRDWCRRGERPRDVPANPAKVYRDEGWESWPDWLGYAFLPFEEAREFVRGLGLNSASEWYAWRSSGERPPCIPSGPERSYAEKGWVSLPDWLGYEYGKRRMGRRDALVSYKKARSLVHTKGLRSQMEWQEWCESGERPSEIPRRPNMFYKGKGWKSWPDWLGYTPCDDFLPFEEAREYMRGLGLKSKIEWEKWSSSGERPNTIPSRPERHYADCGWVSFPDWMGYCHESK